MRTCKKTRAKFRETVVKAQLLFQKYANIRNQFHLGFFSMFRNKFLNFKIESKKLKTCVTKLCKMNNTMRTNFRQSTETIDSSTIWWIQNNCKGHRMNVLQDWFDALTRVENKLQTRFQNIMCIISNIGTAQSMFETAHAQVVEAYKE